METWLLTLLNTAFWLTLHYGFAGLITHLPKSLQSQWFDYRRPRFQVSGKEMAWYRKIGLPKWKDHLPQFNRDFDKRHLRKNLSAEYLETFLFNTCRAEVIHVGIAILGWLSLLFCLLCGDPIANLPLFAAIAAFIGLCNLPFALIQRYNRNRLERLLKRFQSTSHIAQNQTES